MNIRNFTTTILNTATDSDDTDLGQATLVGVYIPASFTGTSISFKAATTQDGTYAPIKDGAGALVSKTVAAGDYITLDPVTFAGVQFLKVVSGSAEGADRSLILASRIV